MTFQNFIMVTWCNLNFLSHEGPSEPFFPKSGSSCWKYRYQVVVTPVSKLFSNKKPQRSHIQSQKMTPWSWGKKKNIPYIITITITTSLTFQPLMLGLSFFRRSLASRLKWRPAEPNVAHFTTALGAPMALSTQLWRAWKSKRNGILPEGVITT